MNTARMYHTSTLLLNGKVLVAGGAEKDTLYPSATAELYDPRTDLDRSWPLSCDPGCLGISQSIRAEPGDRSDGPSNLIR